MVDNPRKQIYDQGFNSGIIATFETLESYLTKLLKIDHRALFSLAVIKTCKKSLAPPKEPLSPEVREELRILEIKNTIPTNSQLKNLSIKRVWP